MNCNLVIFSSAKGHYQIDRYQETINNIMGNIDINKFENALIHIKYSEKEIDKFSQMKQYCEYRGIEVSGTMGNFKHFAQSFQDGYLDDLNKIFNDKAILNCEYTLHLEDDMFLYSYKYDLQYFIEQAINILEKNPEIVQVRFPRFSNELMRVNGLKKKHNIDARAEWRGDGYFVCNDFSANPSIYRTRDVKLALTLMDKNPQVFERHVENRGFGAALKYLSKNELPLAVFNPKLIRCLHIGNPPEVGPDRADLELNSD